MPAPPPRMKSAEMLHEIFWRRGNQIERRPRLRGRLSANAVIIGGGIAGLTVAEELLKRGVDGVVLLEARFCGWGASGRSSGFITPASELGIAQLQHRFGDDDARLLWNLAQGGCDAIGATVRRHGIECGMLPADSLFIASDRSAFSEVHAEHEALRSLGYQSRLYDAGQVRQVIGSDSYGGAVRFPNSFAIDSLDYILGLRDSLIRRGLQIFEDSPVTSVDGKAVDTSDGVVSGGQVFFCLDHAAGRIGTLKRQTYHAQAFLIISEPIDDGMMRSIFPDGPQLVWDTDLIYQYFRPTADQRLLVGGGLLSRTYAGERENDTAPAQHVQRYITTRFPQLKQVRFESWWQGLIGVTKDFLPLAGRMSRDARHFVALCSAGLPWSTLAARTAVAAAIDGDDSLERFFLPERSGTELDLLQPAVPKPVVFALSHYYAKSVLRGDEATVARREKVIATSALIAASAAFLRAVWKWIRRR